MAKIRFKAKAEQIYNPDDSPAFRLVRVPVLTRAHCDMNAFRAHARFGPYANSDLFPNLLAKIRRERLGESIRLDRIPEGVDVDSSGFLAIVSLDV